MTKQIFHKSRRFLALLLAMLLLLGTTPATAFAVTNEEGLIEVRTIADLYNVRLDLTADYVLMNDIDLTAATAKGGDWDFNGSGWNPIGSGDVYGNGAFEGTFDGNGHTIRGMRIEVTTLPAGTEDVYIGLFANVTGTVANLTLTGGSIHYTGENNYYIGAVAGYADGTLEHCVNTLPIEGETKRASYTVRTNGYVGGLIGLAGAGARVIGCANHGTVESLGDDGKGVTDHSKRKENYAGGIAGNGSGALFSQCFNVGAVTATHTYYNGRSDTTNVFAHAAGIVTVGTVSDCYNSAAVSATGHIYEFDYKAESTNAYGIGGTATRCYNTGTVTAPRRGRNNSGMDHGARYAVSNTDSTNCYYLYGTGDSNTGSTALSAAQLSMQALFVGFNFDTVWVLNEYAGHPYPQLQDNVQDLQTMVTLVSVLTLPNKTTYLTGEELVTDGCVMRVQYANGTEETLDVTPEMVTGFDSTTTGTKTLTVTLRGQSDTFTVTVEPRPVVTAVDVSRQPTKKEFCVGTAFDFSGAKLKVYYETGTSETLDITEDMISGANIHHLGEQTVTVTYGGQSDTFKVTVVPLGIASLRLDAAPAKTVYLEGHELVTDGMQLVAVMNNGEEHSVTAGYTVTGYDADTVGKQTVTVTYMGETVSFEAEVLARSLETLVLKQLPVKREYVAGQALDLRGTMLVAHYDNGDSETVSDYTVSGFTSEEGIQSVTVSFGGQSVAFEVTVIARVVTRFELTSLPAKRHYLQYDAFDANGLIAKATYNDGAVETVTDYDVVGFSSEPGKHTVYISYGGFSVPFDIEVTAEKAVDIQLSLPYKTLYSVGEPFETDGLTVTARYNTGRECRVDDFTVEGYDPNTVGAQQITVTHDGISRTFAVTVSDKVLVRVEVQTPPTKLTYFEGEALDLSGMVVMAHYKTGASEEIINYTVSGYGSEPGSKVITVSYGGKSATFEVSVHKLVVTALAITSLPEKCAYIEGEAFIADGLAVTATYNNGQTKTVIDYELKGFVSEVGEHTVYVSFGGHAASFKVTVAEKELVDLVLTLPEKREYLLGEAFDERGLLVVAHYNNGLSTPVDGYTVSGFEAETVGVKEITVAFGGMTRCFTVTVYTKPYVETNGAVKVSTVKGRLSETVEVPVMITQNTGLTAFCHTFTFDPTRLVWEDVVANNGFADGTLVVNDERAANGEVTVVWFHPVQLSESGVAYTLQFRVLETAADGMTEVAIAFDRNDNGNADGRDVVFTPVNGGVEVLSYWTGDLDGDRAVEMVDLLMLAQYVAGKITDLDDKQMQSADVNEDGVIDIHDVTMLSQWLLTAEM